MKLKKMRRKNQWVITGLAVMIAVAGYLNFSGKEVTLLQPSEDVNTVSADGQSAVELEASAKDDEQILYDSDDMLSVNPEEASDVLSENAGETDDALSVASNDDAMISAKVEDTIPEEVAAADADGTDEMAQVEDVSEDNPNKDSGETSKKSSKEQAKETSADVVETAGDVGNHVRNRVLQAQLTKEQNRSKNKEMLMEIINNDQVTKAEKKNATKQLLQISDFMEKESATEQVLSAKGYTDCMVSMSEDSVDVMVSLSEISDTDRAKIEDVVQRKTGVSINNIVISSLK